MIQFDTGPLFVPTLLLGAAALGACFWLYARVAKDVDAAPRRRIIICRTLALLAVIVFLINPHRADKSGRAAVAVLVDGSRSMQTRDEGRERMALARSAVESNVLPNLPSTAEVELLSWKDKLVPVKTASALSATGESSDFAEAIKDTISLSRQQSLAHIVLLSDGGLRSATSLEAIAGLCKRKGIAVHTVSIAENSREPKDIAVESVECRSRFAVDRAAKVMATIRSPGYANSAVAVQLKEGTKVVAEETVFLNGQSQNITLHFTPREKGFRYYEVSVAAQAGERTAENNRRVTGAEVVEPLIRVHYQEGSGRGQAEYIKKALEADPTIKVTIPDPMEKYPKTMKELLEYDVIIFSDIPRDKYNQQQQDNTVRFVADFGGGFVMVGGHTSFGAGGWNKTVIDRIIPVAMEEERSMGGEFVLAPTVDAMEHPIMQIMGTRAENREFWETKRPKFSGLDRVDHAKPGATVMAINPTEKNRFGPLVVWATQEIGRGRSMAFTTDSTVAWGSWFQSEWGERIPGGNDTRYYRKFWNNSVRWLAENRLQRSTAPATLELSHVAAFTGDTVQAIIRVQDENLNPIGDADVTVQISGPTKASVKAAFDEAKGIYLAEFVPTLRGSYQVQATALRPGQNPMPLSAWVRVEEVDTEVFDVRPRPDVLQRLSQITNGLALSANDPELSRKLREGLTIAAAPASRGQANAIWDRWPVLLALLGTIAAEWIIRRRNGLA